MGETTWSYEKLDENGKRLIPPVVDYDGHITGHIVFGVKQWFDENPEERIRLGWIKHIHPDRDAVEYNKRTQYLVAQTRQIDEHTVTDEYRVMYKSEEQMRLEELMGGIDWGNDGGIVFLGVDL